MAELFHAVIASLLLSTAVGCGGDKPSARDEDQAESETGVDTSKAQSSDAALQNASEPDETDTAPDDERVQRLMVINSRHVQAIKARTGLSFIVIDSPADLVVHASSGRSP